MAAGRATLPQRIVFAACICIVAIWARGYFPGHSVSGDAMSVAAKDDIAATSRPLLAALARYRADFGAYPNSLARLTPTYLRDLSAVPAFFYSAPEADWIIAGDGCAKGAESLHRFALRTADQLRAETARYIAACVTGFRSFDLQSSDVPGSQYVEVERWAHYDSRSGAWALGWCERNGGDYPTPTQTASNGVCLP